MGFIINYIIYCRRSITDGVFQAMTSQVGGKGHARREKPARTLFLLISIGTAVFFIVNAIFRSEFLSSYFVADWTNSFMDYYNMLNNVHVGDPYYAYANYPAINFLFLKVAHRLLPEQLTGSLDMVYGQAFSLRDYMPATLGFLVVVVASCLIIAHCVRRLLSSFDETTRALGVVAALFSGPFVFLLERGNLLMLSLSATMIFFAYKNSTIRWQRWMACGALALGAALKLYPAIFALLLLSERRWKDFMLTFVLGVVFLLAPFLLFGGGYAVSRFIQGLSISSSLDPGLGYNYSLANLFRILGMLITGEDFSIGMAGGLIALALGIAAFVLSRHEWERVLACSIMCIWVPSFSYTYALTFLLPALLVLIAEEEKGIYCTICAVCIAVLLTPIASNTVYQVSYLMPNASLPLSWGCVFGNCFIVLLIGILLFAGVRRVVHLMLK